MEKFFVSEEKSFIGSATVGIRPYCTDKICTLSESRRGCLGNRTSIPRP